MLPIHESDIKRDLAAERKAPAWKWPGWLENIWAISPALRQGAILFTASCLAGALNYFYHIIMGRMLGPDSYGVFSSLVAMLLVFSVPASAVQTVVAHYTSGFQAQGHIGGTQALVSSALKRVLFYAAIGTVAIMLASPVIASFLHIGSIVPVIVLGTVLIPWMLSPVASGTLQGLQRFNYLGTNMILGALGRVFVGLILVSGGLSVSGALGGSFASCSIMLLHGLIPLTFLFRGQYTDEINLRDIYGYSGRVLLGYASFAVLTNMDIILVKHFFPPAEAGYYSAASTFGKIVLFLPGAIAVVMFPKSSYLYALGKDAARVLKKSLLCVTALCAPVVTAYFVAPGFLVGRLFGELYWSTVPLIGPLGLAMALYALGNVLLLYYLSVHSAAFLRVIAACAVTEVISLAIFHHTLMQVVIVLMINGLFLLAMSEIFCRGLTRSSPLNTRYAGEVISTKQ